MAEFHDDLWRVAGGFGGRHRAQGPCDRLTFCVMDSGLALAERFFGRLRAEGAGRAETAAAGTLLSAVRLFGLTSERFVDHVATQLARDLAGATPGELVAALGRLCLGDLALAAACAEGDRHALAELERTLIEPVPKAIARLKPDPRFVDEVRQALREKLLVAAGEGTRPKILEYQGRGPLGAWVRVVATRIAYDHLRDGKGRAGEEDALAFESLADGADAPDIAHLKLTYAAEVKAAFAEAVAGLSSEQRAVLRAHAIDGLNLDELAVLYQVHRATAGRWVQQAKGALVDALRSALTQRLGIDTAACDSLVALVRSRIDLSLERALAESGADDG
jgi:RNA polymerase sigma-70 factor, ECF subfamily